MEHGYNRTSSLQLHCMRSRNVAKYFTADVWNDAESSETLAAIVRETSNHEEIGIHREASNHEETSTHEESRQGRPPAWSETGETQAHTDACRQEIVTGSG